MGLGTLTSEGRLGTTESVEQLSQLLHKCRAVAFHCSQTGSCGAIGTSALHLMFRLIALFGRYKQAVVEEFGGEVGPIGPSDGL